MKRSLAFILPMAVVAVVLVGVPAFQRVSAQGATAGIRFDVVRDYAAQVALIQQFAKTYPNLIKIDTYGKSYQGRDLWITSVTNTATGSIEDKPAFWIDAGYDGGETFPSQIALYFLNHLLTGYGKDPTITEILDTRGFYIIPNGNPDAGEQFYQKPAPGPKAGPFMGLSRNAWLIPYDDDGDGRVDEDPPEDLNGDGSITGMRLKDADGAYVTDERDPRLMRLRKPWERGQWRVYETEGIDNDGDGQFNEDWYGGYDTNRGAPSNFDPVRIMEDIAPYPLYAPEAKSFVDALLARPNVYAQLDFHTSGVFAGGSLWECPASEPPGNFPDYDMKVLYPTLGKEWERIMRKAPHSRATAMPVYVGYGNLGRTLGGIMSDFGYINLGLYAVVQEHDVNAPDYNDNGQRDEDDRLLWNDTELKEKIFVPWHSFKHPQLGDVEIGGWKHVADVHGYAPAEMIPWHAERSLPWYLEVAQVAPLVRVTDSKVSSLGNNLFIVTATVRNVGVLDTNVTEHALKVRINGPTTVKASVEGAGIEVLMGDNPVDLGHLKGNQPGMGRSFLSGSERTGEAKQVKWLVKATGAPGTVTVTAASSKGGKHRAHVPLGGAKAAMD